MTPYLVVGLLALICWRAELILWDRLSKSDTLLDRRNTLDERRVALAEVEADRAHELAGRRMVMDDRRLAEAEKREVEKVAREHRMVERKLALEERRFAPQPSEMELPPEVEAVALMESEEWAQNDVRKAARAMFADTKDWTRVIQKLHEVS